MDVELNQRLVPDAREAVNLAGFDHENVASPRLELLPLDAIESSAVMDELNLVARMTMLPSRVLFRRRGERG
jgi:hypothetical protein